MNKLINLLVFCFLFSGFQSQTIDQGSIKKHVTFLASDKLKGRGTSSPEELLAAKYIAAEFKRMGLSSFNNSYLKSFKTQIINS